MGRDLFVFSADIGWVRESSCSVPARDFLLFSSYPTEPLNSSCVRRDIHFSILMTQIRHQVVVTTKIARLTAGILLVNSKQSSKGLQ